MPIVETVTGRIARKYRRPPQERLISEALVCDDGRMRWLVDVEGDRRDIEQLLAQRVEGVIGAAEAHMVLLEVVDPDHADYSDTRWRPAEASSIPPCAASMDSAGCAGGGHSLPSLSGELATWLRMGAQGRCGSAVHRTHTYRQMSSET